MTQEIEKAVALAIWDMPLGGIGDAAGPDHPDIIALAKAATRVALATQSDVKPVGYVPQEYLEKWLSGSRREYTSIPLSKSPKEDMNAPLYLRPPVKQSPSVAVKPLE